MNEFVIVIIEFVIVIRITILLISVASHRVGSTVADSSWTTSNIYTSEGWAELMNAK